MDTDEVRGWFGSATHRGRFARLRADGSEISQVEATYLITDGAVDRRISAIIVHAGA